MAKDGVQDSVDPYRGDPSYRVPPESAYRPSPVQRQILRFLGTGGPAYIATGSRTTRCGTVTGGDRWITTNTTTLWYLLEHRLIVQDEGAGDPKNRPYRANTEHPAVRRLLERA